MNCLFLPDVPGHHAKIRKLFAHMGIGITYDCNMDCDFAFFWDYNTDRMLPDELNNKDVVINKFCVSASKDIVDVVFTEVFGYSLTVDPEKHIGFCVEKGNKQGAHDGKIIASPCKPVEGLNYQKLIDNRCGTEELYDLRVPVIGDQIPLVWIKGKHPINTFSTKNRRLETAKLCEVDECLTDKEVKKLLKFCKQYPVDYCELDVLRDNDGRIYVVDMNNTPHDALFELLTLDEYEKSIKLLAEAFKKMMMKYDILL